MKNLLLFNGLHALVDDEDYEEAKKYKWSLSNGYPKRSLGNKNYQYLHRFIAERHGMTGEDVHHIDRNKLNAQSKNLEALSRSEHILRNGKHSGPRNSKYKGAGYNFRAKRWRAFQGTDHLGYFDTEIEAARAYDARIRFLNVPGAYLNFPDEHAT